MRIGANIRYLIILCIVLIFFSAKSTFAQNEPKKTIRSKIEYFKDQNKIGRLVTTLKIKEDRNAPLENGMVYFYSIGDTTKILLDSILTDKEGQAILVLDENRDLINSSTGLMTFEATYFGDEVYKKATQDIEIKPAEINLTFFQKDTLKYISTDVFEMGPDNISSPRAGVDVHFYIKGTFSLLSIGKEESNENGKAILEFPVTMPGDTMGVLTIVSKIEDDELYGNLESIGKMNWGQPVPLAIEKHRGLGDTDAPLWMVYTLIVLLSIVWFHYFYIIFGIVKIKLLRTKIPPIRDLI